MGFLPCTHLAEWEGLLPFRTVRQKRMRYFGSKTSAVEQVFDLVAERAPSGTFCDPFGGIGTVGSYFKQKGYVVTSGDTLWFAHTYQVARIVQSRLPQFKRLKAALNLSCSEDVRRHLNSLQPVSSWLTREYAQQRRFFTVENARRIDACRRTIARWDRAGLLTYRERAVLVASLIDSMDKVANTAGTYYAFLKTWYRKAKRPFHFDFVLPTPGPRGCRAVRTEAGVLVGQTDVDVLYLDPPYNQRSSARYYHLPETMALGVTPRVHGAAGMPQRSFSISRFNTPGDAGNALQDLLEPARFRLLLFHYSDDGLVDGTAIRRTLRRYGEVDEYTLTATGYTNAKGCRSVKHRLYLVMKA